MIAHSLRLFLNWLGAAAGRRRATARLDARLQQHAAGTGGELEARARDEVLLRATLEAAADGILVVDAGGRLTHWNARFAEMWRIPHDILATGDNEVVVAHVLRQLADPDAFLETVRELADDLVTVHADTLVFTDGRVFERHSRPRRVGDAVDGRVVSFRDVTAQHAAERMAAESTDRLRFALAAAKMVIWARDLRTGTLTRWAAGDERRIPHLQPTARASTYEELLARVHPDDRARVQDAVGRAVAEGTELELEFRVTTPGGEARWYYTSGRVVADASGAPAQLAGVSFDVTARKALEAQLAHQAYHDPLTGLANRIRFRECVEHALARVARGEHVAVLFLDLDEFKTINDSLGHAQGDRLLEAVAARLRTATRGYDTVARLGGDEFAVLLESMAHTADADLVVSRVAAALGRPIVLEGSSGRSEVLVRASIGVAHAAGRETADELLRNADLAMYRAKQAGKARHATFEPAMHAAVLERLELETDLRHAMAHHELRLVYQPIVELASGTVTGFEALLRWRHPHRGDVPPGLFIPVAEEAGLILPLGRWLLELACKQLAHWQRQLRANPAGGGATVGVAVNLSSRQLDEAEAFVADVIRILTATGADPGGLTLEVTEGVAMRDTERTLRTLERLKDTGVRLAIDDFGTGYSSLSYLQRFPIDVLKIDKAFVNGVAHGGHEAALARTVVALGGILGLRTVAEGVEHEAQRDALVALGCGLGQGHLFAAPLEVADATRLLGVGAEATVGG